MSEAARKVREAYDSQQPLRIQGAATWLHAGRSGPSASSLSLADDRGIVEYFPDDLTLTARAGTPLSEIVAATRARDQWLPLDPWGGDSGTVGATVSTATAGPHTHSMGLPRDVVLGLEVVTGTGNIIRTGGKVVKNVAGFDLTRLMTGSWGSLGVITEVTVRLRARPALARTLALQATGDLGRLNSLATDLRGLPFTPLASEVISPALAELLHLPARYTLLIRLGGNARSVAGQLDHVNRLGASEELNDDIWNSVRAAEGAGAIAWRWSDLPSRFGETWTAAQAAIEQSLGGHRGSRVFLHGNPARGVVRVVVPAPNAAAAGASENGHRALAEAADSFVGGVVIEALPAPAWRWVRTRDKASDLTRGVKEKFDPAGILNPGILGESA